MPPLDWNIVKSVLLWLILPGFAVASGSMIVFARVSRSERFRSSIAPFAFLSGLTVGLAVQNSQSELIPFVPLTQVERSIEQNDDSHPPTGATQWEFETGWRSVFVMTVFAGLAEVLIESLLRTQSRYLLANMANGMVSIICAFVLCPWDLTSTRPWVCGLLAIAISLNTASLRRVSQLKFGSIAPLFLATAWCGSAIAVAVLSHSARFADLAMLLGSSLAGAGVVVALLRLRSNAILAGAACFVPALMLGDQQNAYSDIPIASFLLIAIAPVCLTILFVEKARNWFESRPIAPGIWFSIPCMIAVGLAMRAELWTTPTL